jgi:hypothetical protein
MHHAANQSGQYQIRPPVQIIQALQAGDNDKALSLINEYKENMSPMEMMQTYNGWEAWAEQSPAYAAFFAEAKEKVFAGVQFDQAAFEEETAIDDTPPSVKARLALEQ